MEEPEDGLTLSIGPGPKVLAEQIAAWLQQLPKE
jgi:hypothetical protein